MSEVFEFTAENLAQAKDFIGRYPEGRQRSAVMPLLDLAQRQNGGWLPESAVARIAEMLDMAPIRVLEVVTFYSMYKQSPVGKHQINVCTTTPCWLRGSDEVVGACRNALGIGIGETTADGVFTLGEVECLGACVNAPVVQVDDDYYEDVDERSMAHIIDALKRGDRPAAGSQTGRAASAPEGGPLTLTGETAKPAGKKAVKNVDPVEIDKAEATDAEATDAEATDAEAPDAVAPDLETGETEAAEPEVVETEGVPGEDDEAAGDEPRTKKE